MDLTFDKTLVDNSYSAEVKTSFTAQEDELIVKFGEPQVNFGGDITGPPAFTLADHFRGIKNGVPYTNAIDANGDAQAKSKMVAWIAEIRGRMLTAISNLRAQTDDWSGDVIETL